MFCKEMALFHEQVASKSESCLLPFVFSLYFFTFSVYFLFQAIKEAGKAFVGF